MVEFLEFYKSTPIEIYLKFIGILIFVVFVSEYIRVVVIKKAIRQYVLFDIEQREYILESYRFLRFSSGQFKVHWFYLLYPNLKSGLLRNTYYVDIQIRNKQDVSRKITVRIQSLPFSNIDEVTYALPI